MSAASSGPEPTERPALTLPPDSEPAAAASPGLNESALSSSVPAAAVAPSASGAPLKLVVEIALHSPTKWEKLTTLSAKYDSLSRALGSFVVAVPLVCLAIATATRFYNIGHPPGIVFDELHFGKFVMWQMNRWFYFDIHPPFAKLTLAFLGYLWGYDQSKCDYEPPSNASRLYSDQPVPGCTENCCEYWKLRCMVAAFSVGTCMLMYPIARRLGATTAGAALAVALETFNVMHNVEGRLVLLNSQLLFWSSATLYGGLRWMARANELKRERKSFGFRERLAWAIGVGVLGGNAFSVKHTGLASPGLVGVEAALGAFSLLEQPMYMLDLVVYIVSMALTYSLWFAFHFWCMIYSHGTLKQEEEFMTPQYQSLLIGSATYDKDAKWSEGFWWTMWTFNKRMVAHSAATTQPHDWGSRPLDWIFNLRGVSYWGSTMGTAPDKSAIYLFGNPLEVWGIIAVIGLLSLFYVFGQRTAHYKTVSSDRVVYKTGSDRVMPLVTFYQEHWQSATPPLMFVFMGWLLNLLPYMAIHRTTFAYHYMPALVYGNLLLALFVDKVSSALVDPRGSFQWLGPALAAVAAGSVWLYYSPWIYAIPLELDQHAKMRWLERWN